jgi:hypothetical protein
VNCPCQSWALDFYPLDEKLLVQCGSSGAWFFASFGRIQIDGYQPYKIPKLPGDAPAQIQPQISRDRRPVGIWPAPKMPRWLRAEAPPTIYPTVTNGDAPVSKFSSVW